MAPWLSPAAPKRVSGELRLSDGAETASSVAGAYCLITPDALLTRWYPANFLRWGNRIFTFGSLQVIEFLTPDFWILPKNRTLRQNPGAACVARRPRCG